MPLLSPTAPVKPLLSPMAPGMPLSSRAPSTPLSTRIPITPPSPVTTTPLTTASIISPMLSVTSSVSCHGTTTDSAALRISLFNAQMPRQKDWLNFRLHSWTWFWYCIYYWNIVKPTWSWTQMQTADSSWPQTPIFSSSFKRWQHCRNLQGHPPSSSCESSPIAAQSFESVKFLFKQPGQSIIFTCFYRPLPSWQNKLTASLFYEECSALLDHYSLS